MYKELKDRLLQSLKEEFDYVSKSEKDLKTKTDKILQIKNTYILFTLYNEVEPDIAKAINELTEKKKWQREDR